MVSRVNLAALVLTLSLLASGLARPAPASAAPPSAPLPQTAPCYTAAIKALSKQGAIYSQGGAQANDPIDPSTGQPYPRTGPNSFDCSGLVWWAYAQAGVTIGTTTYTQYDDGVAIPCRLGDLNGDNTTCWALGDLVFLSYTGGQHVAIYVGNGLFMDCYNYATGCILHDVRYDSFYQQHFWQARRIVAGCGSSYPVSGATPPSGQPAADSAIQLYIPPAWNTLPDLVGYVSFGLPTCENCGGTVVLPPKVFVVDWNNWALAPFVWLAGAIEDMLRELLCWLLTIANDLACWLTSGINTLIAAFNTAFKLVIYVWLVMRSFAVGYGVFLLDLLYSFFNTAFAFFLLIGSWLTALYNIVQAILPIIGQLALALLAVSFIPLNLISWIGGLAFDLISAILYALQDVQTPEQLTGTHPIYEITHGTLAALNDSAFGWLLVLIYAMAYVAFFTWLARFLSASSEQS